ncbi:MAG TPA: serine hydrolase domain-containing protein [Chryseosolibacter sp.]
MRYVLSICTVLLAACTGVSTKVDFHAQLDDYLANQLPANEPGGAILVMKDDSIVFSKGYGVADINTKEAITPKTLFNLGSISKTFVANAILKLQEGGKLSVEDSLEKYFPTFLDPKIAKKVRIKHLLTHTSGLPDNRNVENDTVFYLTAKDAENWYPVTQAKYLIFEPGQRYEYSNPAFNALALIVEQVSGMKWQTYVRDSIMRPSGMMTSRITDGPYPQDSVAHAYQKNKGQWTEDDYGEEPTFAAAGNGGVWSSVQELAKYELALRDSVFLSDSTIRESRTVKTFKTWFDTRKPFIGWSWFIQKNADGLLTIGHTGDQGGFLCNYVTIPEKKVFFVILCNTRRDVPGMTNEIFSILKQNNYFD